MEQFRPDIKQTRLHFLIESDIRAAEPVDGLFRIPDQKELAVDRAGCPPVRLTGIVGG